MRVCSVSAVPGTRKKNCSRFVDAIQMTAVYNDRRKWSKALHIQKRGVLNAGFVDVATKRRTEYSQGSNHGPQKYFPSNILSTSHPRIIFGQ